VRGGVALTVGSRALLAAGLVGLAALTSWPPTAGGGPPLAQGSPGPGAAPERAASLPDDRRQAIFQDAARAQARARREAQLALPDADLTAPDASVERFQRRVAKRNELTGLLQTKYLRQVAAQHGLRYEEVRDLLQEGLAKHWPVN
jgi:hypothetical protein